MVSPIPVDEVDNFQRIEFLENYRFRKPVVARGAARTMPAFEKWENAYLVERIGDARIQPLVYASDKRDYSTAGYAEMAFREFCARIESGNDEILYWFEGPSSANFWGGEGKHARLNNDIRILADDFRIPVFLKQSEVVLAQLIMGTGKNGTLLHHDFGGEAKALAQLRGEKSVLLVPPQFVKYLSLNTINSGKNFSVSNLKMRDEGCEALLRNKVPVYEAHLKPGDVLYWPSFWFHDASNSGDINLAVNMPVDEVPASPTMVRHFAADFFRQAHSALEEEGGDPAVGAFLDRFITRLEADLVENTGVFTLWDLVTHSVAYRGRHWRKKSAENLPRETAET